MFLLVVVVFVVVAIWIIELREDSHFLFFLFVFICLFVCLFVVVVAVIVVVAFVSLVVLSTGRHGWIHGRRSANVV